MFYDRFTILCAEKGVSPSKAAQDNGISKTSVTRWKNGAVPNADILISLAAYFDVSVDYLLSKTDIKKPAEKIDGFVPTQAEKDFIAATTAKNIRTIKNIATWFLIISIISAIAFTVGFFLGYI